MLMCAGKVPVCCIVRTNTCFRSIRTLHVDVLYKRSAICTHTHTFSASVLVTSYLVTSQLTTSALFCLVVVSDLVAGGNYVGGADEGRQAYLMVALTRVITNADGALTVEPVAGYEPENCIITNTTGQQIPLVWNTTAPPPAAG